MEDPDQGDIENYENYSGKDLQSLSQANVLKQLDSIRDEIIIQLKVQEQQLKIRNVLMGMELETRERINQLRAKKKELEQQLDSETAASPFDK